MDDEELERMILHLGRYALSAGSRLHWRTGSAAVLPGGETAESVVSLALEKVWSGERRWDPEAAPDIKKYLMDVIDSLLSHLATGSDNRALISLPTVGTGEIETQSAPMGEAARATLAKAGGDSPEELLLRKAEEERELKAIDMLLDEAKDDMALTLIIRAMLNGHGRAAEIADAVGLEVKDVYNAMKRLDRKIERVRRKTGVTGV
ncbi:MAG: hypothetical protein M3441_21800 [Chloroflexota bacterium]|nr:hypothetical protein [Chloroflexota bacterium]